MASAIERKISPEEIELLKYLQRIDERQLGIAELDADVRATREELARFSVLYHEQVGSVLLEITRLELEEAEIWKRIELIRERSELTDDQFERQVRAETSGKRNQYREERKEYEESQRYSELTRNTAELSASELKDLKTLYRDLVRRFHPDLASSEPDRFSRTKIMQEINDAFQLRDAQKLRTFSKRGPLVDSAFEHLSVGEKLVWAIREIGRLDLLTNATELEFLRLRESAIHALWTSHVGDPSFLESLRSKAIGKLEIARIGLEQSRAVLEGVKNG